MFLIEEEVVPNYAYEEQDIDMGMGFILQQDMEKASEAIWFLESAYGRLKDIGAKKLATAIRVNIRTLSNVIKESNIGVGGG